MEHLRKKSCNFRHRNCFSPEISIAIDFRTIFMHNVHEKANIFGTMNKIKSDEIKICVVPLQ